jgi:hypothetical protein
MHAGTIVSRHLSLPGTLTRSLDFEGWLGQRLLGARRLVAHLWPRLRAS